MSAENKGHKARPKKVVKRKITTFEVEEEDKEV